MILSAYFICQNYFSSIYYLHLFLPIAAHRMHFLVMEAGRVLEAEQSQKNQAALVTQSGSFQKIVCKWVTLCGPESHQILANLRTCMSQKEQ